MGRSGHRPAGGQRGPAFQPPRGPVACRTVSAFRYPRVPAPRRGACTLRDPAEYLVLLTDGPGQEVAAGSFDDARGKGALAVQAAGVLLVTAHLSGDHRGAGQLTRLAELAGSWPGHPAVLLGDFNAGRAAVASGLGAGFPSCACRPAPCPHGQVPARRTSTTWRCGALGSTARWSKTRTGCRTTIRSARTSPPEAPRSRAPLPAPIVKGRPRSEHGRVTQDSPATPARQARGACALPARSARAPWASR